MIGGQESLSAIKGTHKLLIWGCWQSVNCSMDSRSRRDDAIKQWETSLVFQSPQVWARPRRQFHYGDCWHRTSQEDEDPDGWERNSPALVPGKGNALHMAHRFATYLCRSLSAFEKEEKGSEWLTFIHSQHLVSYGFFLRELSQKRREQGQKQCCEALPQSLLLDLTLPPCNRALACHRSTSNIVWSLRCTLSSCSPLSCSALMEEWMFLCQAGTASMSLGWMGHFQEIHPLRWNIQHLPFCSPSSTQADFFLFLFIQVSCHFLPLFWEEHSKWLPPLPLTYFSLVSYLSQKHSACFYLLCQTTSSL